MKENSPGRKQGIWRCSKVDQAQHIRTTLRSQCDWNEESKGDYKEIRTEM